MDVIVYRKEQSALVLDPTPSNQAALQCQQREDVLRYWPSGIPPIYTSTARAGELNREVIVIPPYTVVLSFGRREAWCADTGSLSVTIGAFVLMFWAQAAVKTARPRETLGRNLQSIFNEYE